MLESLMVADVLNNGHCFMVFSFLFSECGRASVKGGRTSPNVRPQQTQTRAVKNLPSADQKTVEALGVLIQHLVFNVSILILFHFQTNIILR